MSRVAVTLTLVVFLELVATACSPRQEPVPHPAVPVSKWQALSPSEWVASDQSITINVHRIIVTPRHVTLLYSVTLPSPMLGPDHLFAAILSPETSLVTKGQQMPMVRSVPIRSSANVNLGVAVFQPYIGGGDILTLHIRGIEIKKPGALPVRVAGRWEIPLLRDLAPGVTTQTIYNIPGLSERRIGDTTIRNLGGAFTGDSPRGQVATFGVTIGDMSVYLLVAESGDIEGLSEEEYNNILTYLGIQAPSSPTPLQP